MALKEKFNVMVFNHTVEDWSKECEQIADDYAIEFVEWVEDFNKVPTGDFTTKELLEIFKKEKGL